MSFSFENLSIKYRYGIGFMIAIATYFIQWTINNWVGNHIPFLIFVPSVALAGAVLGTGPAILILLTGLLSASLLLHSYGLLNSFSDMHLQDKVTFIAYLCVSLLFLHISSYVRAMATRMFVAENLLLTERLRRDKEEKANLYRLFMQAPGFMAMLSTPDFIYEFSNHAHQTLIGGRDVLGKPFLEAFPELQGQGYFEMLEKVYVTGEAHVATESKMVLRDQRDDMLKEVYVDFVFQPIRKQGGDISGIFIEGNDVTERKRAKESLDLTQARLREGMMAARMAVWDMNMSTGQISFSKNVGEIFGTDNLKMNEPWSLIHPDDAVMLKQARVEAIEGNGHYAVTVRVVPTLTNDLMWVEVRGKIIRDEDGAACAIRGVILDVTQRKMAEESLRESDKRKDDFLAMLAHELRNPLAPISTGAELLKLYAGEDKRIKQTAELIVRQVHHMTALVNDLVDVSRVTRGLVVIENQMVDVNLAVLNAFEQVRPLIEAQQHVFRTWTDDQPAFIKGDHIRLIQVISNLLNNAAKYTPKGGIISLEVNVIEDHVKVSVTDNGSGIAPSLLPHIFDLFTQGERTSDRSQGGLGIGLALVKSIVSLHGGKIDAQSAGQGQGSTFVVTLPLLKSSPLKNSPAQLTNSPSQIRRRIMVVDDNRDAADVQAILLEAQGHTVIVREDGASALAAAATEVIDVFILDIGLPDMTGHQLAGKLQAQLNGRPALFIALTGYGQSEDIAQSKEAGFHHHFVKPVKADELLQVVSKVGCPILS